MENSDNKPIDTEAVKIIEWEDFDQELTRLWSLSSAHREAKEKKIALQQKLESLIQVRSETLSRSNELEEMRQKLDAKRLVMGNLLMRSKATSENVRNQEEQLNVRIRSLLVAGKALSVAYKQIQESNRLLAGERGHVHLKTLQKLLRMRLQYMVAQVSALYPVKALISPTQGEKLDSSSIASRSGPLAIFGLQLTALPLKKMSFFIDKKEIQRSATALGYVAHAVLLIASYLDVPLRYPVRLGGSRSYINDYASSVDSASSTLSNTLLFTNSKPTEFPLFLEGQDTTRAAYAIFLLNKDLEQLLNFIGIQSLGPRHVLANLMELLGIIQSQEYIERENSKLKSSSSSGVPGNISSYVTLLALLGSVCTVLLAIVLGPLNFSTVLSRFILDIPHESLSIKYFLSFFICLLRCRKCGQQLIVRLQKNKSSLFF